jgi:hypothetical protein
MNVWKGRSCGRVEGLIGFQHFSGRIQENQSMAFDSFDREKVPMYNARSSFCLFCKDFSGEGDGSPPGGWGGNRGKELRRSLARESAGGIKQEEVRRGFLGTVEGVFIYSSDKQNRRRGSRWRPRGSVATARRGENRCANLSFPRSTHNPHPLPTLHLQAN